MNERTTNVSNSNPNPIVVPICPIIRRSLTTIDAIVTANTNPAVVTTRPDPPIARTIPVLMPAGISSRIRATSNRL